MSTGALKKSQEESVIIRVAYLRKMVSQWEEIQVTNTVENYKLKEIQKWKEELNQLLEDYVEYFI